ncbi:MAG: histidinol-phosphate transaminase [Balneolaceae bacterium]
MDKTTDIESLIRPNIRDLTPYRSARDDFDQGILMDANENSLGSPIPSDLKLNRYPDPAQKLLRKKIASFRQVDVENVFVGVGSDEPIDLLIRIFCEPGEDQIITTPPTYGMYGVSARINNVGIREVLLDEKFQPDVKSILNETGAKDKILFLCSPNNPTANDFKRTEILKLITLFEGIVVVDEAYIDFSRQESMAKLIQQYSNLVVLQTFSKSFGLAGIRLGIALGNPVIIQYLMKIKAPYNVNKLTADSALKAFEHLDLVNFNIDKIREEREILMDELRHAPTVETVYRSDANFILFRIHDAYEIYQKLAEKGIVIRYRGNEPRCENCLRVTVGMPDENDRFLKALKELTT